MKRFFTLTLMLFCFILHGFAFEYTDENGVTWTCDTYSEYNEETGTVKDYTELTGASNYGAEVIVPEKVYDGETAYTVNYLYDTFKNSETITKVTLPNNPIEINGAFSKCHNLVEVVNSQYITKCCMGAFEYTSLTSIDLSNCKYVGGFDSSKNLKTVILKVCKTIEESAFVNCTNLISVGETASVISIGESAFIGTGLKEITLPAIERIENYVFRNCSNLTKVDLPKVTTIGYSAFEYTGLEEITLPATKEIGYTAFKNCSNLTKVDLPKVTTIGLSAFEGTGLEEITLSAIERIENKAFKNCSNLTKVDLPKVTTIGESAFECTGLKDITLPATKEIGESAFENCSNLTKVDLPKVTTIEVSAFEGTGLEEITLPATKEITHYAFRNCSNLTKIDLPKVTTIGYSAFEGTGLEEITLPATITFIGNNAFNGIDYVTINTTKVPGLSDSLGENTVVLVPEEALNAYKTADVWKDIAGQIFAIGAKLDYEVKTTAQENAPGLLQQLDKNNLNNIVSLKVSGTINGYDIMLFRNKMDNLHHLDLSDADIVANPYEYYQGRCTQDSILGYNAFSELAKLITVKCPKSVKQIYGAFTGCYNLKSVVLPEQLEYLGDKEGGDWISGKGSFTRCNHLTNILFYDCKEIGNCTFQQCCAIQQINIPEGVTRIGESAFYQCKSLKSIIIPNGVETIETDAFHGCGNLRKISFPPSLKEIKGYAFQDCSLDSISLPGLTYIGYQAFADNSNLKELRVPSTLEKIEERAFSGCNLEKVYAYTVLPISINQNTFSNFSNTALYVPTQSVDNYYLNTQWSQFKEIHEFNEPYKYFYLDKEFTLEDKRFDGTPDIDIKEDGGLKVDGKDNQEAGDVTIKGDGDKGNSGTLITDGNLNAKKMRFDISVSDNKWYFFSFPFDIKLSDTKAPGEYKWKMYDGSIRADQGSGGWVNLPDNEEWLKQGKGYIFQTNKAGTLTLKVTKEKFGQLDANNIMKELDVFPSGNNFDASWNFIGNPQTSYYNVNDLGYEAPITVWNGNSYEAVRPGDDDYTLHPFQAFFVQKPTASSTIEFKAEDRLTKTGSEIRAQETKARRLARGFVPSRMIINLNVSDGSLSDKTRVVFNDKKSRNYEMDCDAAKFMTLTQAPQLYSVEGKGTKFAINERPMGSVQLGFTAKKSGTFTISAVRMDQPMLLKDNVAGITIDLTNGDYEFTSEAGTFNKRFLLTPNSSVTSIADVVKKTGVNILPTEEGIQINGCNGKNVDVYNLNGAQVASSNSDGMLRLSAGVYIVKVNGMSTKVMVK